MKYKDHEYALLPNARTWADAAEECASSHAGGGASLPEFESLDEFYAVTKALFVKEEAYLLRQLKLSVWVGARQTSALDLHWMLPSLPAVSPCIRRQESVSGGTPSCVTHWMCCPMCWTSLRCTAAAFSEPYIRQSAFSSRGMIRTTFRNTSPDSRIPKLFSRCTRTRWSSTLDFHNESWVPCGVVGRLIRRHDT